MAATYQGNQHLDSIIYAENSDTYDFPVKGYMVGKARTIWTYNDCLAPDFGIVTESYQLLFTAPGTENLGIITRIELDAESCNNENFNVISNLLGADGTGRNDDEDLNQASSLSESLADFTPTITDLSLASDSAISPGAWEASHDFTACNAHSADDTFYDFIEAIFEGDDIIEYEIGSSTYNVPFTDWLIDDGSCTMDLVYDVREFISGVASTNLNVVVPTFSNLNVGIESSDLSIVGVDHTVTVMYTTNAYQCLQKDFTVKPYSCTLAQVTGSFWISNSLSTKTMQYTIGSADVIDQVKFTSSQASCTFEVLLYEYTDDGLGNWSWTIHADAPDPTNVLSIAVASNVLLPG